MERTGSWLMVSPNLYAMTGWRLGYGIMPQPLADKVTLLLVHSVGCTAEFTQLAGITALEAGNHECKTMRDTYRQRRDLVVDRLNQMEDTVPEPRWSFPMSSPISKA